MFHSNLNHAISGGSVSLDCHPQACKRPHIPERRRTLWSPVGTLSVQRQHSMLHWTCLTGQLTSNCNLTARWQRCTGCTVVALSVNSNTDHGWSMLYMLLLMMMMGRQSAHFCGVKTISCTLALAYRSLTCPWRRTSCQLQYSNLVLADHPSS